MRRWVWSLCLCLSSCAALAQAPAPKATSVAGATAPSVRISFFHDADLDGRRTAEEAPLRDLSITASAPFAREADGAILLPSGAPVRLHVEGFSPASKPLVLATLREPRASIILPDIDLEVPSASLDIGLADGFLTSPLAPPSMNLADYGSVLRDPTSWMRQCDPLYPEDWPYERNYFFYGYRIPVGPLEGQPHLAFDLWALPGTPVLAAAPGTIVPGLYDWRFGIEGPFGVAYYNHIVPTVKVGDRVERYQVVGWIAEGQGNHVHFEIRPDPGRILEAFPGMGADDLLKTPAKGEAVRAPAWFGGEPLSAPQEPTAPTIGGRRELTGSERRP